MKSVILVILVFHINAQCIAQQSLTEVYSNHEFPCDTESTTLSANICSGVKAEFVDSLMNKLYRKILRSIDKEISRQNSLLKQAKQDSSKIKFALKQKSYYQRMKQVIISSQQQWIRSRERNCEVEAVFCEGGTGCVAIVNEAYIEDTLDRIRKLESFNILD